MIARIILTLLAFLSTTISAGAADVIELQQNTVHLRQSDPVEWSRYVESDPKRQFESTFSVSSNENEWTLCLSQRDVKQNWTISLNGERVGSLHRDENAMQVCYPLPKGTLNAGENRLTISTTAKDPDDIELSQILILPMSREEYLSQVSLSLECFDGNSGTDLPCRFTILNDSLALQEVNAETSNQLAVRPGVVYSATGQAKLGLPPGKYRIIAGRGPEYSIATEQITIESGSTHHVGFSLKRVVDTSGWIACDTHVHTLTHSGHGDASVEERLITICGEGLELPIATDHNKQIDYTALQKSLGLSKWFTPVVGNEVTTKWGHFNIFPAPAGGPVPDHTKQNWSDIFSEIKETAQPEVIILNHAEDVHSGFKPFGIENRHRETGKQYNGWQLQANAMEIVNSGAQQTEMLRLPLDWMTNLNRGLFMTPVGSSDSHDVARFIVAQGRTYIECDDTDPGHIDVEHAVQSFKEGRVIVSCGLFPRLTIEDQYTPGDLVPQTENRQLKAKIEIHGPDWADANHFAIYMNGQAILEQKFTGGGRAGLKFSETVELDVPQHDVHLELVVTGSGVTSLHWPIASPYQPDSPEWTPLHFGMTGAIWYDGNGDGKRSSAREIAIQLVEKNRDDHAGLIEELREYHQSISLFAAELLHEQGVDLNSSAIQQLLTDEDSSVAVGFRKYLKGWIESQTAIQQPQQK